MEDFRCTNSILSKSKTPTDGLISKTWIEQKNVEDSVEKCYSFFKNLLDIESDVAQFLSKCQDPDGGFSGGPGQKPHLAPTYAAVNALCILGTDEAFNVIDRASLQRFLLSMHQPDGSFTMHLGGEVDIRGTYCAASAARLTNITTKDMFDGTAEWIVRCQTYEGGFGGIPGMEAHGGYAFCALAALVLIDRVHLCDIKGLLMSYEGGFQGRTNKLVDGCYSFWQGGSFPLVHMILTKQGEDFVSAERWLFHQEALQEYIMICCQHPHGGLLDKPGKPRDFYHTCYCLSGLSVAQHFSEGRLSQEYILGSATNQLNMLHPVFNISIEAVQLAQNYFSRADVSSGETSCNGPKK
ncbi:hypothetical protein LSH36_195g05038 [Paralvinella palmiformis]|uniref:Protein farnesyltransferase subunit beta n=1 Tax=Paralvinella palmiformis TaxID=53620 RepID=A0AAD9JQA0_9ANNE|nr:hypothetical protein LSH36_195g05038 [Paralvinella palmiformis]